MSSKQANSPHALLSQPTELDTLRERQVDFQNTLDIEKIKLRNKFRNCDEAFMNGPEQIDVKIQRYTSCILGLDPPDVQSREGWWNFISPDAANIGVSIARGLNVGNALS